MDSAGVLVGAFIGLCAFTFLYEIASFYQSRFVNSGANRTASHHKQQKDGESPCIYGTFDSGLPVSSREPGSDVSIRPIPLLVRAQIALLTPRYILSSLLFPLLVAANYFIMLAVMTYNAWLLIAVCLASGAAYFVLHPDKDVPPNSNWYGKYEGLIGVSRSHACSM